jgi:hypothetical protein
VFTVTPKNPDGGGQFVFVVTNTAANDGLSFHVIIKAKQGEVPADSKGYLCVAKFTNSPKSIGPMTRETQVTLKTGKRAWNADFVASDQLLSNPDACFVFTILDHRGPAADFYVLKLLDFATRGVTLRISVPSMVLKPNGNLPAFLVLSNGGFLPIRFTKLCTPLIGIGPGNRFEIDWIAGSFNLHPGWTKAKDLVDSVQTLKPGESAELPFEIIAGTNKTMYVTARYEVSCSLSDSLRHKGDYEAADTLDRQMNLWQGEISANPLTVHIQ